MLTKKNKRKVRKMKKYIKTFQLTEKEIDQMIEDITGMAEEAQERNENFETVLGKSVHEFCDDLIYSVGGIRAPGGRKLIRGTSIYFQLLGLSYTIPLKENVFPSFVIYSQLLSVLLPVCSFLPQPDTELLDQN